MHRYAATKRLAGWNLAALSAQATLCLQNYSFVKRLILIRKLRSVMLEGVQQCETVTLLHTTLQTLTLNNQNCVNFVASYDPWLGNKASDLFYSSECTQGINSNEMSFAIFS